MAMDIDIDPCCCLAMGKKQHELGLHYGLRWIWRLLGLFLSTLVSPDLPLFAVLNLLHFSFAHLSTPYLHVVVVGAAGESCFGQSLWVSSSFSWQQVGPLGIFKCLSNTKLPKEINLWLKLGSTLKL